MAPLAMIDRLVMFRKTVKLMEELRRVVQFYVPTPRSRKQGGIQQFIRHLTINQLASSSLVTSVASAVGEIATWGHLLPSKEAS